MWGPGRGRRHGGTGSGGAGCHHAQHRPHVRLHAGRQGQLPRRPRCGREAHHDDAPASAGRPCQPGLPAPRGAGPRDRVRHPPVHRRRHRPSDHGERARGGPPGGAGHPGSSMSTTIRWSAVTPARCCRRRQPRSSRPTCGVRRDPRPSADPADHRLRSAVGADVHERAAFRARPARPVGGHRAVPGGHGSGQLPGHLAQRARIHRTTRVPELSAESTASRRHRWRCAAWSRSSRLFDGFELLEPGLVWISEWRPGSAESGQGVGETLRGGVARKAA